MNYQTTHLFDELTEINRRPELFEVYTAKELWDDEHISHNMLAFHLNPEAEPSSRPQAFIQRSAAWIIARFSLARGRRLSSRRVRPVIGGEWAVVFPVLKKDPETKYARGGHKDLVVP